MDLVLYIREEVNQNRKKNWSSFFYHLIGAVRDESLILRNPLFPQTPPPQSLLRRVSSGHNSATICRNSCLGLTPVVMDYHKLGTSPELLQAYTMYEGD
jgi:hypothetical protein